MFNLINNKYYLLKNFIIKKITKIRYVYDNLKIYLIFMIFRFHEFLWNFTKNIINIFLSIILIIYYFLIYYLQFNYSLYFYYY